MEKAAAAGKSAAVGGEVVAVRMTEKSNGKNAIASFFKDSEGVCYLLLCSKNTPMILPYHDETMVEEKEVCTSKALLAGMYEAWSRFWNSCAKEVRLAIVIACLTEGVTIMWEFQDGKHMVSISQARPGTHEPFAELTVPMVVNQVGDLSQQRTMPYDAIFANIPILNRVPAFVLSWNNFANDYKSLCFRNPFRPGMQTEGFVAEMIDGKGTVVSRFKIKNWSYVLYRALREWIRSRRGSFSERLRKKNRCYMRFSETVLRNIDLFCTEGVIPLIDRIAEDCETSPGGLLHFQNGVGMGEVALAVEKRLGMSLADCFHEKYSADHSNFLSAFKAASTKAGITGPTELQMPVHVVTPDPDPVRAFLKGVSSNGSSQKNRL